VGRAQDFLAFSNNTFNVLSSTSPLITVITTNQPSFDVNGCYLKAEYWLNVTTAGTSSTGTVTFTVNEGSEFIQFPTPVVTTQTYERSITSNVGLSGLFAKTNNFERTSPLSLGFSSSFSKLSEFERFIASGIGLSGMFERITIFPQIFERMFDVSIGFLWNVIKLPWIGEDIILEDRYAPAIGAIVVLLISLAYIMLI